MRTQRLVRVDRDGGVRHLQQRDVVARIAVAGQVLVALRLEDIVETRRGVFQYPRDWFTGAEG